MRLTSIPKSLKAFQDFQTFWIGHNPLEPMKDKKRFAKKIRSATEKNSHAAFLERVEHDCCIFYGNAAFCPTKEAFFLL